MADSDAPILPLPPEVAEKVHSSAKISNLNGVIIELAKNSLDAGAGSLSIVVDHRRGGCIVEDDGHGIPTAEFRDGSGMCRPHHTSKANKQSVSSCKGQFLAALATMSLLTVSSRHRSHSATNSVIFHESKVISRLVHAPPHQEIQASHGTRITVNNLFGNMPVRVKHRASSLRRASDVDKEWEELTRMLVALALSNANFQKLRLSDRDKSRSFGFRIHHKATESSKPGGQKCSLLRVYTVLAQSGLISGTTVDDWVRMSASTSDVSIKACVALCPRPTRLNQFISLGINPIFDEHKSANVLFDEINHVFAESDFGTEQAVLSKRETRLQVPTRSARRWPMFYVRIDVENSLETLPRVETNVESDRALQRIIEVLHAMFYQFLQQHHYRPRRRQRIETDRSESSYSRNGSTVPSASIAKRKGALLSSFMQDVRAKSRGESFEDGVKIPVASKVPSQYFNNFTNWSRVKGGDKKSMRELLACRPRDVGDLSTSVSNFGATSPSLETAQIGGNETEHSDRASRTSHDQGDQMSRWVDPITQKIILVNSRTGQCFTEISTDGRPNTSIGFVRPRSTASLLSQANEPIQRPQTNLVQSYSPWLENLVKKCDSPVFSCPEKPIVSMENRSVFDSSARCNDTQEESHEGYKLAELIGYNRYDGKMSRGGLGRATIVAQVDRKFILVKMAPAVEDRAIDISNQILVLVDQHAADERCRLEILLSEMFEVDEDSGATSVRAHVFPAPIQCTIQEDEVSSLAAYSKYFESWGCHYRLQQETVDGEKHHTIIIDSLPLVIAERCRSEPNLFLQLLRKDIWSRAGERIPPLRQYLSTAASMLEHESRPFPWLRWMAGCPEGILDLINSRACRSSIMFNDILAVEECQSLISRLSKCAFPFQCAHGRPTMIPIVDQKLSLMGLSIGSNGSSDTDYHSPERRIGFVEAFKKWDCT